MSVPISNFEANYIHSDSLPYFPTGMPGTDIKLLKINPISGQFMILQKSKPDAIINIHKHYGTVIGYTVQGAWGYKEYDWIARAGDVVFEAAGSTHTLMVHPGKEDTIIFFIIDGALEFLDEKGNSLLVWDWKGALAMYHNYCKQNNLEIVDLTKYE
jgi:2,4'-dihydroxyacetophenone dioxygenase